LKVEQEMNRVRTQIEQLEGQLRVMADRIALSTITLRLREPARTVPEAKLSIEVPSLDDAAKALNTALAQLDGRMLSGKVTKRDAGAMAGEYRLNVMLNRFGEALATIAALGRVDARDVTDWREQSASAPWANRVPCELAVTLFERKRELPSGSMAVEIPRLEESLTQVGEVLDAAGASVAGSQTTQREDGSRVANLTVSVRAGNFATLAEQLAQVGRVTARQLYGEAGAIQGGAADAPCTLAFTLSEPMRQIPSGGMVIGVDKFADARDRLSALVTKRNIQVLTSSSSQRTDGTWAGRFKLGIRAAEIDEAVTALEQLGKIVSRDIQGVGLGELSHIDPNAVGVLDVVIAEKAALTPGTESGDSFRKYLRDGVGGLYNSLGMIAYGLILMAPWLIIAAIIGWLIARLWRRRANRKSE
ncbi:MAG: DUF4349 domain-containing protein, partial [Phycisphaerales bacterium]|nr:DUF4349 domain-containing protein [Phycisphaerales bacterium]